MKNRIWAIIHKDIREILSRPKIWLPMILVPFILTVVQPLAFFLNVSDKKPMDSDFAGLARTLATQYVFQSEVQKQLVILIDYFFPVFFLMIPLLISSIIAANSFAGEKERKTLETLLYSPLSLKELFFAKILGTFIPAYFVTCISFLGFCGIVRYFAASYLVLAGFPNARWLVLIGILCPALVILALTFTIWISAKCSTYQEAQQMGGLTVIPVVGLMMAQISGMFIMEIPQMLGLATIVAILDYILISLAARMFSYEELLR